MSNSIVLPSTVSALRDVIRTAIEHFQGSPVKNENKLNETLAVSLGFQNHDQLSPLLAVTPEKDDEDIETYRIDFDSEGDQQLVINGMRIDVDLVHEEVVAYTVADREDRIHDLRMFISEAQDDSMRSGDVPLMQSDLDSLLASNEQWVLEEYGTNGFIASDSEPKEFNEACDEMMEAAADYYKNSVGELSKTGGVLEASSYYSGDPIEGLHSGELVLIKANRLSDDELPLNMPVYKYEGEVKEGYIAAYKGACEYIPVEMEDITEVIKHATAEGTAILTFPLAGDDWRSIADNYDDSTDIIDEDNFEEIMRDLESGHYTDYTIELYIQYLIDLCLYENAIEFVEYLIRNGKPYFAGMLSNDIFDACCPMPDDALYVKYLKIAAKDNKLFNVGADGVHHENECGVWVPGHKSATAYKWFLKTFYLCDISVEDVTHGYLVKEGYNWSFSDRDGPNSVPITTCLDDAVLKKLN